MKGQKIFNRTGAMTFGIS